MSVWQCYGVSRQLMYVAVVAVVVAVSLLRGQSAMYASFTSVAMGAVVTTCMLVFISALPCYQVDLFGYLVVLKELSVVLNGVDLTVHCCGELKYLL